MDRAALATVFVTLLVVVGGVTVVAVTHEYSDNEPERIGIICAMPSESKHFIDNMSVERMETICSMDFYVGVLKNHDVVVVQCGVGKVNAGVCAQTLISEFNVKSVINSGVAGALDDDLKIGDFVISTDAVQHDYNVSPLGYPKGEILYTGLVSFKADDNLVEKAKQAITDAATGAIVKIGRVCSGDQFIDTQEKKDAITSEFGGLCCEMEGGAIAQICYLNKVPFVIIRGISDNGDDDAFEEYQELIAYETATAVMSMVAIL